jgi:16S rRNA (cytidine1402-2'-O)-methyltransferase
MSGCEKCERSNMSSIKTTNLENEKNKIEKGMLYLVATPIGNLADLSERAVKVLSEVDFVAAEDTRNSMKLLSYLGISKPMVSYFEHNKRERGEVIVDRLKSGESCALITDAGTPAISDPGEDIVALCAEVGVPVTSIPGACAGIVALTLSGLPTGRFTFEGFLSANKGERRERLSELENEKRTMFGLMPLPELEGKRYMSLNWVDADMANEYQAGKVNIDVVDKESTDTVMEE